MKKIFKSRSSFIRVLFLSFVSFLFLSCATSRAARASADYAYKGADYHSVEKFFAKENKKGDKIDLTIDEAMVKAIKGEYKESIKIFNEAYRQMERLSGEITAGDQILAGLTSEESIKYSGPAYEYSLLDSMSAYNFIRLGDLNSARAMMRRSLNNNKELFNKLKAQQKAMENASRESLSSAATLAAISAFETVGESVYIDKLRPSDMDYKDYEYQLSPFIFYLGSLLFANDNKTDMARDWMWNVSSGLRSDVVDSVINIPDGKGSINVITLTDNIVRRVEAAQYVPVFKDIFGIRMNFKLTWPYVPKSNNIVKNVYVTVKKSGDDKKVVAKSDSVIVEDFDQAVRLDVASKVQGAYDRSLIRNVTRKSATYVVSAAALIIAAKEFYDNDNPLGWLFIQNGILGLQAALEAIDVGEHADLRQGAFFPSKARTAGIIVDPGIYDIIIDYIDKRGVVINREVIPSVVVSEGEPSVVASDFINTGNLVIVNEEDYYD